MHKQKINSNQQHVFPAGTVQEIMMLGNHHNVTGLIKYKIGNRPMITVPIHPNRPGTPIINIDGLPILVINYLPNSICCVW